MTDFVQKLRQGATCLKYQLISMKFGHNSQNLGNYLHKLKNFDPDPSMDGENDIPMKHTK